MRKAFSVTPVYILSTISIRIIKSFRTSFMSVFFLPYIISSVENGKSVKHVLCFSAVCFTATAITYLLQAFYEHVFHPVCLEKITASLQQSIFEKALETDIEMFDREEYYTSIALANREGSERIMAVLENMMTLLEAFLTAITIVGYALVIGWIVSVVAFLSFGISVMMNQKLAKGRVEYDFDLQNKNKEEAAYRRILYLPEYARDVRMSGIRDIVLTRYRKNNREKQSIVCKKGGKLGRMSAWKNIVSSSFCVDFAIPLYLAFRILVMHSLDVAQFVAVINSSYQLQLKLEDISREIAAFFQNGEFIERFRCVERLQPKIEVRNTEKPYKRHAFLSLTLKGASFCYDKEGFGLSDLNLTIQKNEKIAIVGQNGAGKSTLMKLLLRFYDWSNGDMYYNDISVKNMDIQEYRQHFSMLFQDYGIYATTLGKNISMDHEVDEEKASEALRAVGLEDMIPFLHKDLTRELSDEGRNFSGGQLLRIALARLIYENHEILLMDEPTAALDVVAEKHFYEMVRFYLADKTVIFVSHRLAAASVCDRIIYMENGKIIEEGTHRKLMEKRGGYARLFEAQTKAYQQK